MCSRTNSYSRLSVYSSFETETASHITGFSKLTGQESLVHESVNGHVTSLSFTNKREFSVLGYMYIALFFEKMMRKESLG